MGSQQNLKTILILVSGKESKKFVEMSNSLIENTHQDALIRFKKYDRTEYIKTDFLICLDSTEFSFDGSIPFNHVNPWGTVILNLEDTGLCHKSNETGLKIQWFAGKDPRRLLGLLLSHYEGAFQDSIYNRIVYQTCNDIDYYAEHSYLSKVCGWKSDTIALVCALRAAGTSKTVIKDLLEKKDQAPRGVVTHEVEL